MSRTDRIAQWLERHAASGIEPLAVAHHIAHGRRVNMLLTFEADYLPPDESILDLTRILAGGRQHYRAPFRAVAELEATATRRRLILFIQLNSSERICFTTSRGSSMISAATLVSPPSSLFLGRVETSTESDLILWCISNQRSVHTTIGILQIAARDKISRGTPFFHASPPPLTPVEWEAVLEICIRQDRQTFYRIMAPDAEQVMEIRNKCQLRRMPIPDWLTEPDAFVFAIRTDAIAAVSWTSYFCISHGFSLVYSGN